MKRTISYLLFSLCCVIAFGTSAAERKITGVVIAGDYKEPLIGASVFVSSENLKKAGSSQTSLGVITDMDGKFTINVPEGVTSLQCSYVGYESQTIHLAAGKNSYEVVLQPSAHMLDAVVVTGYQTIERRKLTAAVTKLDITDDKIGSVMSIDQALSGQVPYCVQTAARHQQRSIVYFFILVCCAASTPPFSLPHKNASVPTSLRIFQTLSPINVKIYQGSVVILNIFFLFCPYLAIPRQIRYTHSIPFYK